ncbi:MarR family transcriptional regulator [Pseudomonas sp. CFBP 8770]|uniref:MarR family winged helix-turn-helix transcriptional regulator n=1 Tax=unclassified Pseudomonas TaxID=196821 RepID=UPI001781A25D|nr:MULTISPECIES: MarR family transcriptional regulator [unclassified Pseudomonas]MBD8473199.1 MarR family transcriptional regulator [Pseudomonas sp. CFBP 8773]MBD8595915.1 MarR family transcriptional regulator [Pseudomonas sp. CFBP 8758]MBD8646326.1 MarR family transcriptional regulator [Pseudomonas sp. CFBP 8770]MBD8733546.1 MarR family transcriptional regulator [Pseudomonas sp. CFBP 13710]
MTKTKDFVDNYLPALLGQAWHLVSTQFHAVVEEHGLSVLEWRVLSTLASHGAMSISALAQVTVSKQPTVTRLLLRLEAQGYVDRSTSLDDRRFTLVRVTRAGRRLVAGLIELAEKHEVEILASFEDEKISALKEVLHELIARHQPKM